MNLGSIAPMTSHRLTGRGNDRQLVAGNTRLQQRVLANPLAYWVGMFITQHRRHPLAEMHLDMLDDLAFGMKLEDRGIVFKAPRKYSKTTICTENYAVYQACEYSNLRKLWDTGQNDVKTPYPYKKIMIITDTGSKAIEIMSHIKHELEQNELIRAVYGNLQGEKWTEKLIITTTGVRISVQGRGAQVRGFGPDIAILDDIEEDKESLSDIRREETRNWIDMVILPALDELECKMFMVGTELHPDCALNYVAKKPGFKLREVRAYVDGIEQPGNETWPSKWPHEKLQIYKNTIGPRAFAQEYMGKSIGTENPIFIKEWFRTYDSESESFRQLIKNGELTTFIGVDPATSKADGNDYNAIVTASATRASLPDIYIRVGGVLRGHWSLSGSIQRFIDVYDQFRAMEIGIETVAYQHALADEFRAVMEMQNKHVKINELIPHHDKETRALRVTPAVHGGRVYVDFSDEMSRMMVDECVQFQPGVKNIKKDLMDSFVYCLMMISDWAGRFKDEELSKRRRQHIIRPYGGG